MSEFITNATALQSELIDEIRIFYPFDNAPKIIHTVSEDDDNIYNLVNIDGVDYFFTTLKQEKTDILIVKRELKHACKKAVYQALNAFTGKSFPWGSLTGIRPSKLVYDMLDEGILLNDCDVELSRRYFVSESKSKLIRDIVANQRTYVNRDDRLFNLYVHIPFCTSKCSYCSFTTQLLSKSGNVLDDYLAKLRSEIQQAIEFINQKGKLYSVYVGGGTPTAISAEQLYTLLNGFDLGSVEFTVEAGRPDTITDEKLDAIKRLGTNRICVNPQSLNDKTLQAIGRSHTAEDFYTTYFLAQKYGFDINVDLIAGLADETLEDFIKTLNAVIDLAPENVTVHTLSRKNGSALKQTDAEYDNLEIEKMTDYARKTLTEKGYLPYYLYRQKQMLGNLENVGYCKSGKQCINNISTMEEFNSVIACGAGAISKIVRGKPSRITRFANLRDVKLYIERFDEKAVEKNTFLLNEINN